MAHIGACTMRLRNTMPRMLIGRPSAGNSGDKLTSHEARRRRRPPDHGVVPAPDFRPLRLVPVPRAGLEIAELLVFHLIELDVELDELIILVPVKDGNVVARAETQWAPDQ